MTGIGDHPTSEDVHVGTPLGLNNDPKAVFRMIEEAGEDVLYVSGEIYGGLTSKRDYRDYHLQLQFKWGEKKWIPRLEVQRDNGLLYHCTGPHGAFWNVWMRCLEFQIQERDMGDFFALAGANAMVYSEPGTDNKGYTFEAGAEKLGVGNHYGNYRCRRSTNEELPNGEWNTLDLYTIGGTAIHMVNGKVVNVITEAHTVENGVKVPLVGGKIQLQSEAAEAYFKGVRIKALDSFPADVRTMAGL